MVLNPECDNQDRKRYGQVLDGWSKLDVCPVEDPDHRHSTSRRNSWAAEPTDEPSANYDSNRPILGPYLLTKQKSRRARSIFQKSLDALKMDWADPILNKILHNKNNDFYLWNEHLPTACARIDALKTHGYDDEALRLAVAISRTLRQNQSQAYKHWTDNRQQFSGLYCTTSGVARKPGFASLEGWIGHALNPIGCLFNTLIEACIIPEDKSRLSHHLDQNTSGEVTDTSSTTNLSLRYHHVPIQGSRQESYLSLALETALIALGQQRIMPSGLYAQEMTVKQEEKLLAKLQDLDLDSTLVGVLVHQTNIQMDMGPTSGLGLGVHPESIPMQTYAKYLFHVLLPYDGELAFKVGLRAMRLPILDEMEMEADTSSGAALAAAVAQHEREHNQQPGDLVGQVGGGHQQQQQQQPQPAADSSFVMSRVPRWFTLGHIESQQCALASRMLNAAKGTPLELWFYTERPKYFVKLL